MLLGRAKLGPRDLHDKVLFADADMNKADWQTAAAGIVGVIGIVVGLWWLDGVAAILIGASITRDGWKNLRTALSDLMDSPASVFDDRTKIHPAVAGIRDAALAEPVVRDVQVRVREEGHVFHAEVFVVPTAGGTLGLEETLKRLEGLQPDDPSFDEQLATLMREIREHVAKEEGEMFPHLRQVLSQDELVELGAKVESVKKIAPTRPHPSAPDQPPGNKVLGPVAGQFDRIRDAVSRRGTER